MISAVAESRIDRNDYLKGEMVSPIRHEYVDGRVYTMAGGTWNHQHVAMAFTAAAWPQMKGKRCVPTTGDFKIRIDLGRGGEAFYYPDAAIVCEPVAGDAQFTDSPTVVLEVLSPSTRRNDEGRKRQDYLTIPTLRAYLVAEADFPQITVHRRDGDGFREEILTGRDAVLELPEVGVAIPLTELYPEAEGD